MTFNTDTIFFFIICAQSGFIGGLLLAHFLARKDSRSKKNIPGDNDKNDIECINH